MPGAVCVSLMPFAGVYPQAKGIEKETKSAKNIFFSERYAEGSMNMTVNACNKGLVPGLSGIFWITKRTKTCIFFCMRYPVPTAMSRTSLLVFVRLGVLDPIAMNSSCMDN